MKKKLAKKLMKKGINFLLFFLLYLFDIADKMALF